MRKSTAWVAVVLALSLVMAACGDDDAGDTTAAPTTAAPATTAAPMAFEGKVLVSGGCGRDLGYTDEDGEPVTYGGSVNKITAVDEYTVEFELCGPAPAFLAQIAFGVFGIQPEEHLEATGGSPLDNPIGTGPYELEQWVRGDSVVFTRFDDYYGQKPAHETAVLRWATESAGRLLELNAGQVDGITFPATEDLEGIDADPNLALLTKPEPNIFYVGFTDIFPPFDDVRVRQAIGLALDRQRIVDTFYAPGSEVASHFTPCSVENGCQGESWYERDVAAAQALMADAGFEDGFTTQIFYRDVTRGYLPTPGDVATDISAQLMETLNIDAQVVQMESGEFIQQCSTFGQCEGIHLLGWTGDYPHVTNFLDFHFAAGNAQYGDPHPEIYEPLALAAREPDPAAAGPLYEQANNAIKDLVPMVPIAHAGAYFAAGADVQGAHATPWGHVQLNLWDNGTDTLVFMQGNEPISLFCADESDGESLRACGQVVEALDSYTIEGEVQPQLATECTSNADLSVWTCSLREGVLFHDGSTFDANDVIASYTVGLDASSPLHVGNSGVFEYYDYLWGGLINPPAPEG